jgi:hypothetical protein
MPVYVTPVTQGAYGCRSIEHMKVGSVTLAVNANVAVVLSVSPPLATSVGSVGGMKAGPFVMVVQIPRIVHS